MAHRYFETWITWEARTLDDGRKEYTIALSPIGEYMGTRHKLKGTEKMVEGSSRGIHIVRQLTDNICEWTRTQQVDIKASLPKLVMDMMTKAQMAWANELEEKHRRNGKEVDREMRLTLAELMMQRQGMQLNRDQEALYQRCKEMDADVIAQTKAWKLNVLGWKNIKSPSHDVHMSIKYLPPKKGERSIATGRAEALFDSSAEKVAAWFFNFCR